MQFQSPSGVQALPAVIAEPEPVVPLLVPVLAELEADATGVEATDATGDLEAAALETGATLTCAAEEATELVAAAGEFEDGDTVMNTPPETDAAEDVGAFVVAGEEAAALEAPVATVPDPVAHAVPTGSDGVAVAVPNLSTESPGSGNSRSDESTVLQALLGDCAFATNIFGRALNAAVSRSMSMV